MNWILIPWIVAYTILLGIAAYWIYMLEGRLKTVEERYQRILSLAEEGDQVTIVNLLSRLDEQEQRLKQSEIQLAQLAQIQPHTLQGYGVVRYNAFADAGGEQSFSLALVDESGSGVMLSSLHGRGETRIYAKPLEKWRSTHTLSAEEQQSLGAARLMVEGIPV
ncbi:MAG: DUF4446 family protein [Anaerolineae bacterium]|nr:DUF4446 family protein [Anaerolineae bacterium]